jgi:sulfoxide reductase heme-binding subunit YedZ
VGFTAFVLLVPLAVTSTQGWMRRLGRRWHRLHRLVYPAAILGCTHFWWQVKADWREPAVYAALLAGLLWWRIQRARRRAVASAAVAVTS